MSQFALEITDLKKIYDSDVVALKGINLTVQEGDFFALLGPNGAGKSSTIGIIASLVTKTDGKVKIFNIDETSMWGLGTPEDLDFFLKNHETYSS